MTILLTIAIVIIITILAYSLHIIIHTTYTDTVAASLNFLSQPKAFHLPADSQSVPSHWDDSPSVLMTYVADSTCSSTKVLLAFSLTQVGENIELNLFPCWAVWQIFGWMRARGGWSCTHWLCIVCLKVRGHIQWTESMTGHIQSDVPV